jgi:hypothetical protein
VGVFSEKPDFNNFELRILDQLYGSSNVSIYQVLVPLLPLALLDSSTLLLLRGEEADLGNHHQARGSLLIVSSA